MTKHVNRQTLIRERAALGIDVDTKEKNAHTVNEIGKMDEIGKISGTYTKNHNQGLKACLLGMTVLIQETMAETTEAPNEWLQYF